MILGCPCSSPSESLSLVIKVSCAYQPHVPQGYPRQHEAVPAMRLTPSELLSSALQRAPTLASSSLAQTTTLALTLMSHTPPTAAASTSKFQLIINNALDIYQKRTKNDLLTHPLAAQLQSCNSPSAILAILQEQVQGLDQSRSSDERWSRWLDPTVNVLYALSETIGAGVGLVCLRT
jgi:hypothetical protein